MTFFVGRDFQLQKEESGDMYFFHNNKPGVKSTEYIFDLL